MPTKNTNGIELTTMAINITIQNESSLASPEDEQIKGWINAAVSDGDGESELTVRIVDEEEGRELNKHWRKKDYATNVLSFPIGEALEGTPLMLGDIVICAPVVKREALEQTKEEEAHWAHMVVHGVLHLQGYDHEMPDEAERMEALEISILDNIGYANPYAGELAP